MIVNQDTGEIFIYGPIGESFLEDGITDELMVEALATLGGKRAKVRINSPGGSADQGIAIYRLLRRYEGGVDTYIDSIAASAASVIALAGEKRVSLAGSRWMIHRALTFEMGNASDLRKTADMLETYDRSLVEIYEQHLPQNSEEIMELLEAESWFTSSEAVTAGLATSATEEESDETPVVASWYKHAPEAVVNASQGKKVQAPLIRANAAKIAARKKLTVLGLTHITN